jgi:signal transduction histidine kinase
VSRTSLGTRVAVASLVVALLAAVVAALTATRVLGQVDRESTRAALATQADTLALALADHPAARWTTVVGELRPPLADQNVEVVAIGPRGALTGPDAAVAAVRRAGVTAPADVSRTMLVDRRTVLVESRQSGPGGFALVQTLPPVLRGAATRAIWVASLIGLVGAGIAGAVLSGVVSRPLRRVASVAHQMRDGRRDLRVPVEGPREVADVAASVNALAASLERSEDRERAFLHSVSHELRTPLTAVRGFAESIADGVTTGAQAQRAGATILAEAGRLDRLVGDLLDLARLGAADFHLDLADVDLVALVGAAGEVWRSRGARSGVPVTVHAPERLVVRTDPGRFRQVVDALADNALRVTPAGRPLVLDLAQAPGGTGGAVLEVRDGGPGLAPEDYPVAFERGVLHARYRAERAGSSGIGLNLVAGLVSRLGGRISAHPAPEGGAAFRVELPATHTSG